MNARHIPRTWALVANEVRARILRGLEDTGPEPFPPTELVMRSRFVCLRVALTESSGRGLALIRDSHRAGMDLCRDPVAADRTCFAQEIGSVLDRHRAARDFTRLAIFAPPRMLATLTVAMPPAVLRTIVIEDPCDLLLLAEEELRRTIRDRIARHHV